MALFSRAPQGLRLERMKASAQHDGERFVNRYPSSVPDAALTEQMPGILKMLSHGDDREPVAALPSLDPRGVWTKPAETGLRATWLGHSTVLLEIDGRFVLTDPVWGPRASPFSFLGPKRFQPVPVAISALPKLDFVLVSHDHYDHLDYPTIKALAKLGVPFVTSLGVGMHLEAFGVDPALITELDWWGSAEIGGLTVTAAPAHHFSGRSLQDRNQTLWSSFVIKGEKHSLYFGGDGGLSPAFEEIGRRLGPFDLVMMEVGAYLASPGWGNIHLGPDNALAAWRQLGSGKLLPVHWGTFNLAMHAWYEPAETLLARKPEGLLMPRLGEPVEPARAEAGTPWWRPVAERGNSFSLSGHPVRA